MERTAVLPSTSRGNTVQTFFDDKQDVGRAKHQILSRYLGTWLAILNQNKWRTKGRYSCNNPQYARIVYVDGFSGPGFYSNGVDPGSPAVVYELALTHKSLTGEPHIFLIFIEKNAVHCQNLFLNLNGLRQKHLDAKNASKIRFMVIHGEFVNAMNWILSPEFKFPINFFAGIFNVSQHYEPLVDNSNMFFITTQTPLFVFVDPFGYNGEYMPMTLMQYILMKSEKAELFINIMTGFIRRFFNLDNRTRPINLLVGVDENDATWKPIVLEAGDAHQKLNTFLEFYQLQVSAHVPGEIFMTLFEMRNKGNMLLYNLLHVTRHTSGFDAMKKAMRSSSQSDYSFKYSTYAANKPNFTRENVEIEFLKQEILEHFMKTQYRGSIIRGSEISSFLNAHPVLYQRYKNELKKCLEEHIVGRNDGVNLHMMRFDEISFKFF